MWSSYMSVYEHAYVLIGLGRSIVSEAKNEMTNDVSVLLLKHVGASQASKGGLSLGPLTPGYTAIRVFTAT